MRILLLGATGQIGWELRAPLAALGTLVAASRDGANGLRVDTADVAALHTMLDSVAPDVIVNATAYTAVDRAESEPDLAMRLNADVPAAIGGWAAGHGVLVVHYSTDYVFDGSSDRPYRETDTPNPLSVYGRSKLAGDEALLVSGCDALILRVCWVYGRRRSNFLTTMLRMMRERDELRIVEDQVGSPSWCRTIARHTADMVARTMSPASDDPQRRQRLSGIYHLAPAGSTSWYGFASRIREYSAIDCRLLPIPTTQYPTPAVRPRCSLMDTAKISATFDLEIADWTQDLHGCMSLAPDGPAQ